MSLQVLRTLQGNPVWAWVGYSTVAEWWREKWPVALALLDDPARTFNNDADTLKAICAERGLHCYGKKGTPVFPRELLAEFYPDQP